MTAHSAIFLTMRARLMEHWDPIGIKDVEQCCDEYDAYIPSILTLMDSGVSRDELAQYLDEIVCERMGMRSNMAESARAAAILLDN